MAKPKRKLDFPYLTLFDGCMNSQLSETYETEEEAVKDARKNILENYHSANTIEVVKLTIKATITKKVSVDIT